MKRFFSFFVIATVFLSACDVEVETAYDLKTDFKKYKTFCWMDGCEFNFSGPEYLNDSLIRENIKEGIIADLSAKGISYDADYPDLLIDFHITVENQTGVLYHYREDEPFYYAPLSDREEVPYHKGTVIIHIADKEEGRMVWRAQAIGYMDVNPDITEENLRKAITLSLKNFPPKED